MPLAAPASFLNLWLEASWGVLRGGFGWGSARSPFDDPHVTFTHRRTNPLQPTHTCFQTRYTRIERDVTLPCSASRQEKIEFKTSLEKYISKCKEAGEHGIKEMRETEEEIEEAVKE